MERTEKRTALRRSPLLLLAVVCILYCLLTWNQAKAGNPETDQTSPIYVTDLGPVSSFSIETKGSSVSFDLEGEEWKLRDNPEQPLSQKKVQALAGLLSKLPALSMIQEPQDLESYGLSDPQLSFEITTADSTAALLIGDSAAEGQYYACLSGGTLVYTIGPDLTELAQNVPESFLEEESLA